MTRSTSPRFKFPRQLIQVIAAKGACDEAIRALRSTRLSPLALWKSEKWNMDWKLWALKKFGTPNQARLAATHYSRKDADCLCDACTYGLEPLDTRTFLKLFPRPPKKLLDRYHEYAQATQPPVSKDAR